MFQSINEYLIATEVVEEATTASGIFIAEAHYACSKYKVVHTNELTKQLQDKIIYAEARFKNHQLPDKGTNGETYVVIPLKDVLAIKQ